MKKTIFLLMLAFATTSLFAQKKTTTSATISFDATTSKDALPKAENKTAIAAINVKTGSVAFEAIMKSFTFSNPMMQQHFNGENWLSTDKFPTATFKGMITNIGEINLKKDGTYNVDIMGNLTLHGKTQPVKTSGTIIVSKKKLNISSEFTIKLEEYGINGSAIAAGKVAMEPKIRVSGLLK